MTLTNSNLLVKFKDTNDNSHFLEEKGGVVLLAKENKQVVNNHAPATRGDIEGGEMEPSRDTEPL